MEFGWGDGKSILYIILTENPAGKQRLRKAITRFKDSRTVYFKQ
jgi:hypothetical protein